MLQNHKKVINCSLIVCAKRKIWNINYSAKKDKWVEHNKYKKNLKTGCLIDICSFVHKEIATKWIIIHSMILQLRI